jgi:hypothetical protein
MTTPEREAGPSSAKEAGNGEEKRDGTISIPRNGKSVKIKEILLYWSLTDWNL